MNKAFLRLNDASLKSGLLQLNPNLVHEFKLAKDTFSSLVKTANEGQYEGEEDVESTEKVPDVVDEREAPQPEPETQHIGWGYSTISDSVAKVCEAHRNYAQICLSTRRDSCSRSLLMLWPGKSTASPTDNGRLLIEHCSRL